MHASAVVATVEQTEASGLLLAVTYGTRWQTLLRFVFTSNKEESCIRKHAVLVTFKMLYSSRWSKWSLLVSTIKKPTLKE